MVVSGISIWLVYLWSVFASVFYSIRYRKTPFFQNPWTMVVIFAVNFFMFAWAAFLFILIEWVRWSMRKKKT